MTVVRYSAEEKARVFDREETHRAKLYDDVMDVAERLLKLLQPGREWRCRCCGRVTGTRTEGEWVSPRDLRDQLFGEVDAPVASLAVSELLKQGLIVTRSDWMIRLRQDGDETWREY